jgi:hypothetical protein
MKQDNNSPFLLGPFHFLACPTRNSRTSVQGHARSYYDTVVEIIEPSREYLDDMSAPTLQKPYLVHKSRVSHAASDLDYTPVVELEDFDTRLLPQDEFPGKKRRRFWPAFRTWIPRTRWTAIYGSIALAQAFGCLTAYICFVAIYVIGAHWPSEFELLNYEMPLQLLPLAFEPVYQLFLVVDAARTKNVMKALGVCLNQLAMVIFGVLSLLQMLHYIENTTVG